MTSGVMRKPYIQFSNVPEELWSDSPIDVVRGQPEPWADRLADEVEIQRLLGMGVLQKRCEFEGEISGTLTTRFVYDWRLKTYDGACSKVNQNVGCDADVADMLQENLQTTNVMMCIHLQLDVIHQTLCQLSFFRC